MPSLKTTGIEALVIGAVFVFLFFLIHIPAMAVWHDEAMFNHWLLAAQVFVAAAVGHIAFEATGMNRKFCDGRYTAHDINRKDMDNEPTRKPYTSSDKTHDGTLGANYSMSKTSSAIDD